MDKLVALFSNREAVLATVEEQERGPIRALVNALEAALKKPIDWQAEGGGWKEHPIDSLAWAAGHFAGKDGALPPKIEKEILPILGRIEHHLFGGSLRSTTQQAAGIERQLRDDKIRERRLFGRHVLKLGAAAVASGLLGYLAVRHDDAKFKEVWEQKLEGMMPEDQVTYLNRSLISAASTLADANERGDSRQAGESEKFIAFIQELLEKKMQTEWPNSNSIPNDVGEGLITSSTALVRARYGEHVDKKPISPRTAEELAAVAQLPPMEQCKQLLTKIHNELTTIMGRETNKAKEHNELLEARREAVAILLVRYPEVEKALQGGDRGWAQRNFLRSTRAGYQLKKNGKTAQWD